MPEMNEYQEYLIAKFSAHIMKADGGAFTPITRKRLVGIKGLSGRGRTKNDFWYDVRERLKRGLIDIELFIEFAKRDQVNQALTEETLAPIVTALLKPFEHGGNRDPKRAEIAHMFVEQGLEYLRGMNPDISQIEHRAITEAVDLSKHLVYAVESKYAHLRNRDV